MSGGAASMIASIIDEFIQTGQKGAAAEAQGRAEEWNAVMREYEAWYAKRKALVEEADFREIVRFDVGSAVAIGGASGFSDDSGTSQAVVDSIIRRGALDAATIKLGGKVEAWGAKAMIPLHKAQAFAYRASGAASSVSGAAQIAAMWWKGTGGKPTSTYEEYTSRFGSSISNVPSGDSTFKRSDSPSTNYDFWSDDKGWGEDFATDEDWVM